MTKDFTPKSTFIEGNKCHEILFFILRYTFYLKAILSPKQSLKHFFKISRTLRIMYLSRGQNFKLLAVLFFCVIWLLVCLTFVLCFRLIVGLSISLGFFALELIGFFGGITMFMPFQSLLCILCQITSSLYYRCLFLSVCI